MGSAETMRTQVARHLALDHNQLRRTSDRIEAWLRLVLVAGFVPLAVLACVGVAGWVRADGAHELQASASLRQLTATLLTAVPPADSAPPGTAAMSAPARWTAGGRTHIATVPAVPGTAAGAPVRIWIDASGNVHPPPLSDAQVDAQVVLASMAAPAGVALGLWLLWCALKGLLDRHRMARWAKAWSLVAPLWTR